MKTKKNKKLVHYRYDGCSKTDVKSLLTKNIILTGNLSRVTCTECIKNEISSCVRAINGNRRMNVKLLEKIDILASKLGKSKVISNRFGKITIGLADEYSPFKVNVRLKQK